MAESNTPKAPKYDVALTFRYAQVTALFCFFE